MGTEMLVEIPVGESVLYQRHPAMFRNHPVGFLIAVALSPVGVGLLILGTWWLQCLGTTLTVTNRRVSLRRGVLSKHTNDVFHNDIRNIRVDQTLFQRMLGTGYVGISSSGQAGIEIEVNGIPDPEVVKGLIDRYR